MNRRNFIKITGLGAGSIALSSSIISCSSEKTLDSFGWDGPDNLETDIRMRVLAYAILAPNPHNKQPWIIKLTGENSFNLYVDPDRLLPETDPVHRQVHIGQGTFLETLSIAASGLGYVADIQYFPEGTYSNMGLEEKPVASVELHAKADGEIDPLFHSLLLRHSNKREYDGYQLSQADIQTIHHEHQLQSHYPLVIHNSKTVKNQLVEILTEAMRIEVSNTKRDLETVKMFRFNDAEIRQYRDGFGVAQTGMTGFTKLIAETFFLDREKVEKDTTEFGNQAVEMTQKVAQSTHNFAFLSTPNNTRLDQVQIGRDYCRINLQTTKMGLALHPMSQVLQEYGDMINLQNRFKQTFNIPSGDTVQMLFRLGKAEVVEHSPRRLVKQLIRA